MAIVWEVEDSLDLKISAMLRPILPNFDGCTVRVKFLDGGSPMDDSTNRWRTGTGKAPAKSA